MGTTFANVFKSKEKLFHNNHQLMYSKNLQSTKLVDLPHTGTIILQGSHDGCSYINNINWLNPANLVSVS